MATIQVKRLKAILKEVGIKENVHLTKYPRRYKNPDTGKTERFNEYGPAFSVILKDYWTPEQLQSLRDHDDVKVVYESDIVLNVES